LQPVRECLGGGGRSSPPATAAGRRRQGSVPGDAGLLRGAGRGRGQGPGRDRDGRRRGPRHGGRSLAAVAGGGGAALGKSLWPAASTTRSAGGRRPDSAKARGHARRLSARLLLGAPAGRGADGGLAGGGAGGPCRTPPAARRAPASAIPGPRRRRASSALTPDATARRPDACKPSKPLRCEGLAQPIGPIRPWRPGRKDCVNQGFSSVDGF
jgi:hypothetical protein